jgi:glucan biosynthesis protein C
MNVIGGSSSLLCELFGKRENVKEWWCQRDYNEWIGELDDDPHTSSMASSYLPLPSLLYQTTYQSNTSAMASSRICRFCSCKEWLVTATWICWVTLTIALLLVQGFIPDPTTSILEWIMMVMSMLVYPLGAFFTECCRVQQEANDDVCSLPPSSSEHVQASIEAGEHHLTSQTESTNMDVLNEIEAPSPTTSRPRRIFFLDMTKVFLTALVVSHHVSCAFGGCGQNSWYLTVGLYDSWFNRIISYFSLIDQSYFMPLFFFISASFTPSSYGKKGKRLFHLDKAKRLSLPLLLITLTICPFSYMIGQAYAQVPISYIPQAGPGWFLAWLILFNVVYSTIREAKGRQQIVAEPTEQVTATPFPSTVKRVVAGIAICGIVMGAVIVLLGQSTFALMPIAVGSLICDIFLFGMGIVANNSHWLDNSLREQMDISHWVLWIGVVAEAVGLWFLVSLVNGSSPVGFAFVMVAGMFCVDMGLAVLEFLQSHADYSTPTTKFFSDAAYTVYLVHPIIITGLTAVFIEVYRAGGWGDGIQFTDGSLSSSSQLAGPDDGGAILAIGWLVVNVLAHVIVWPLSWGIRKLPLLRMIL